MVYQSANTHIAL